MDAKQARIRTRTAIARKEKSNRQKAQDEEIDE